MNGMRKKAATAAMAAGLIGGGAAGLILGGTSAVGAEGDQPDATQQDQTAQQEGTRDGERGGPRHGPRRRHAAKVMLTPAAEALGMSVEDLAAQLHDGRTIAEVAAEKGVDKQVVIDAMVAEASERITKFVDEGPGANKGD